MRVPLVVLSLLLAGCKGKAAPEANKPPAAAPPGPAAAIVAPTVSVGTVLASDGARPPFLYLVDDAGVRVAGANTWAELDANRLEVGTKPIPVAAIDEIDSDVRDAFAQGTPPGDASKALNERLVAGPGSAQPAPPSADRDDPPPPAEPDDGPPLTDDEREAADEAAAAAREAAIPHDELMVGVLPDRALPPHEDGSPSRVAQVAGAVRTDGKLERLRAVVVMAPGAKASMLIPVVARGVGIAVSWNGKLRPLRLDFARGDGKPSGWLEARVSASGLQIEAVPDAPVPVAALETAPLAAALDKARAARGLAPNVPVDVLVDADVSVQRLVDVLVALDTAGVRVIGLGEAPSGEQLARRGHRIPTVTIGKPVVQGDHSKASIRKLLATRRQELTACYTGSPSGASAAGAVSAQFVIAPSGEVMNAAGSVRGLDQEVVECVKGVIKALAFPPQEGSTQVIVELDMQP